MRKHLVFLLAVTLATPAIAGEDSNRSAKGWAETNGGLGFVARAVNEIEKCGGCDDDGELANEMEGVGTSQSEKPGKSGIISGRDALIDRLYRD